MNSPASNLPPLKILAAIYPMIIAFALGGCAGQPLGIPRVISGYAITPERASFIQSGGTTRGDVLAEFGGRLNPPRWEWSDQRGIAYSWSTTTGGWAGIPAAADPTVSTFWLQQSEQAFCVVFDESDRVIRTGFFRASDETALRTKVEQWLGIPTPQ